MIFFLLIHTSLWISGNDTFYLLVRHGEPISNKFKTYLVFWDPLCADCCWHSHFIKIVRATYHLKSLQRWEGIVECGGICNRMLCLYWGQRWICLGVDALNWLKTVAWKWWSDDVCLNGIKNLYTVGPGTPSYGAPMPLGSDNGHCFILLFLITVQLLINIVKHFSDFP